MLIVALVTLFTCKKNETLLSNFQILCFSVSAFRHNLCFTDIHTDNQKDLQELREEKLFFSSFFRGWIFYCRVVPEELPEMPLFPLLPPQKWIAYFFFEKYSSFSYFFDEETHCTH